TGFQAAVCRANTLEKDIRSEILIDPDHFELRLQEPGSLIEWEARKKELRQKLLLCSGLWPPPEKNPLNTRVFDEKEGAGFRVAKVYFESLPGYLATGNLYRPGSDIEGPFPAVVCPHGHWMYGRLTNTELGSLPGRCIDLARMGFVVFHIDMVGYNDNFQLPHDPNKSLRQMKADKPQPYEPRLYRGDFDFPEAGLYGFSLGGLQVWNCIRAVDFLCSLPEVDSTRIGVTGASGGASQTMFLMIADQRIKAAAPVNIIGAAKHPGCRCENMPGLWVDASTVELAASFSPRPLILLSATNDPWTNSFPTRELPIFKKYYALYGAGDMVKNVHIKGVHNYNAESRAAVYEWFCKHLEANGPVIENPAPVSDELEALGDLRVFPDKMLPESAISGLEVIENWKKESERIFDSHVPGSGDELEEFAAAFGPALAQVLQVRRPEPAELISRQISDDMIGYLNYEEVLIGREGKGDRVSLEVISSGRSRAGTLVLVCPDERGKMILPGHRALKHWVKALLDKGYRICRVGGYASGELAIPQKILDSFSWSDAYNRDNRLNGIQDIITALSYAEKTWPEAKVSLAGIGRCGILCAFAGAVHGRATRVLVDMDGSDPDYDSELVKLLPVGSIKRLGGFRAAAILAIRSGRLTLANASPSFESAWYESMAKKLFLTDNLFLKPDKKVYYPDDLF
ncbi:MAG: hypothetical protein U9N45_04090, partial [Gemmatimonadota bacterium]|nr:hypothetical protein [Gemmatimonadota bacterium]